MGNGTKDSHRVIPKEHIEATMARFLLAHESCPSQLVEFHRGDWSLVCWCRWCSDLETYEVRGGQ
ncbi:MAG TPA: hypothetical protein VNA27_10455 [Rubrobacteraceae bacterium]|nr:hypothetical protein [Rubrobacteraceae bacterium]